MTYRDVYISDDDL